MQQEKPQNPIDDHMGDFVLTRKQPGSRYRRLRGKVEDQGRPGDCQEKECRASAQRKAACSSCSDAIGQTIQSLKILRGFFMLRGGKRTRDNRLTLISGR